MIPNKLFASRPIVIYRKKKMELTQLVKGLSGYAALLPGKQPKSKANLRYTHLSVAGP